jgi:hypothetical protein
VEETLWGAIRALEEAGMLLSELSRLEPDQGADGDALQTRARQTGDQASAIRDLLRERSNLQAR